MCHLGPRKSNCIHLHFKMSLFRCAVLRCWMVIMGHICPVFWKGGGAGCKMFVKLKILQRRKTFSLGVIHFYRQKHSVPNDGGKHSSNKCYVTNTFPSCCRRADSNDTVVKYRPLFLNKKPKITDI